MSATRTAGLELGRELINAPLKGLSGITNKSDMSQTSGKSTRLTPSERG